MNFSKRRFHLSCCLLLLLLFAVQGVAVYLRTLFFGRVGHSVVRDLRSKLYEAVIRQPVAFFDRSRTGDLLSRLGNDTAMVQDAVSIRLSVLLRYTVQVAAGVALMAWLSPRLTIILVTGVPLLVLISIFFVKTLRRYSRRLQSELGEATTAAEESFGSIRLVHAFDRADWESRRFSRLADKVLGTGLARLKTAALFMSSVSFLMNAVIVIVFLYGFQLVLEGALTAGDLTGFLLYGIIVAVSFTFLVSSVSEIVQAAGAAERVFELLNLSAGQEAESRRYGSEVGRIRSLAFEQVSFAYPGRPDQKALREVTFLAQEKQTIALVGPSGAGKSTVVNLLLGFYQPQSGSVLLNGKPSSEFSLSSIRDACGYVPQEPLLFADSIRMNLLYGRLDAEEEELRIACRQAQILDFVESLPEGFDTFIGERGVHLSGGQKQRLSTARALLRDPSVLIFDEATSSLDSENEALIQAAIEEVSRDRLVIVIAHRLATVQSADQILVLRDGHVIQVGTHEELIGQDGLYRVLATQQELSAQNH